ncbi:MAG: putative zinc-binding metallopeptidase [Cyanobacteriota/Melainabacteria group bacterium]|nr:hypothetical protein [Cyanobacteria bacterium HKST-UBA01]MCB9470593.1 hypothetical protein [Candidatus Obscuribacterales bacterium]
MDELRELTVKLERCFLKLTGTYERQPRETSSKALQKLGREYGIKIITKDSLVCRDIRYDAATRSQVVAAKEKLINGLRVYSPKIIKKSGVEQIILCRNLTVSGTVNNIFAISGLAMVGYDVVDTLFLDAGNFATAGNNWIGERVFHHELYHAIDYRDSWFGYIDSEWKYLQGPNFKYGYDILRERMKTFDRGVLGERVIRDYEIKGVEARPSNEAGFVSDYARISYVEDKAEVFASLITDYKKTMARTRRDLPLKRKVEHMKTLLAKFCSDFNDDFWKSRA